MILLNDIKSQQIPPAALTKQKLLITGPVGVGKTTIAKALAARWLGVEGVLSGRSHPVEIEALYPFDVMVISCGAEGIEKVRELIQLSMQAPSNPDLQRRAFILDEVHALLEKAVQALLPALDSDKTNLWVGCTSRPAAQLDPALRSRLAYHLNFGGADVAAVLRAQGVRAEAAAEVAKHAQGDLRLALTGNPEASLAAPDVVIKQTQQGLRLNCPARKLHTAALRNPHALQAQLLDETFDCPSVHLVLCVVLSPRNDIAAHQLVAACRKAGLLGTT